jgi:hypothetical protein
MKNTNLNKDFILKCTEPQIVSQIITKIRELYPNMIYENITEYNHLMPNLIWCADDGKIDTMCVKIEDYKYYDEMVDKYQFMDNLGFEIEVSVKFNLK